MNLKLNEAKGDALSTITLLVIKAEDHKITKSKVLNNYPSHQFVYHL